MSAARISELGLVAVAALFGLTFVMVQDAIATLPVMAFLAYRFASAAALVGVMARRRLRTLGRTGVRAGALMGAFLTAGYVLQTFGLEETTVSNAGFITGLFVVLTPVLAAIVLGTRLPWVAWGAAAASLVGIALLSGVGSEELRPLGDGLVLGCALAFSAHILATDRGVRAHDVTALHAVQLTVCGGICLLVAAGLGQLEAPKGATVWSALIVTAVGVSAIGFWVQSYAQQHADPARTALILASEPAFAGLFGYLLADDRLSATAWIGAAIILAAIVAVDLVPRLRPPRPLPEG